jgi:hypothetical protein
MSYVRLGPKKKTVVSGHPHGMNGRHLPPVREYDLQDNRRGIYQFEAVSKFLLLSSGRRRGNWRVGLWEVGL